MGRDYIRKNYTRKDYIRRNYTGKDYIEKRLYYIKGELYGKKNI